MDHFFQIRERRPRRGADARGLDDARVHGRALEPGADRPAWSAASTTARPRCGSRPTTTLDVLSGGRAWLGIGAAWNEQESNGLGLPVPAARRAVRDARGHAPLRPRHVGGRAGQRGGVRGSPCRRGAPAELPAVDQPAPSADHDRGRRRAEDAAPGRAVRRRHATCSGGPETIHHKYEVLRRALRGDRPRPRGDRADSTLQSVGSRSTATTARAPADHRQVRRPGRRRLPST